jgi:hypothetical protein
MICSRGLTLAIVVFLGWTSQTIAQPVVVLNGFVTTGYGDSIYANEPYGGFGMETIQVPLAGTFWVDRFGMVHATEPAQPLPRVAARRPGTKTTGTAASRRVWKTGARLPAGSLEWSGSSGVVLYSPWLRYQSYGSGYGRGPYGNTDCGIMYKGMWLGY